MLCVHVRTAATSIGHCACIYTCVCACFAINKRSVFHQLVIELRKLRVSVTVIVVPSLWRGGSQVYYRDVSIMPPRFTLTQTCTHAHITTNRCIHNNFYVRTSTDA